MSSLYKVVEYVNPSTQRTRLLKLLTSGASARNFLLINQLAISQKKKIFIIFLTCCLSSFCKFERWMALCIPQTRE
jgi:hypothetical protein